MPLADLRQLWRSRFKGAPPPCRAAELLRYEIAYRMQSVREGDVDAPTRRAILTRAKVAVAESEPKSTPASRPAVGTRLVREWRGQTHRVDIVRQGFLHEGTIHRSLSSVACKITGAHWSGARFFRMVS